MPWSGEEVRGRGSRAASRETENPLKRAGPLREAETRLRRRQALGGFVERRLTLE
jgi:hypothetical protein